MFNHFWFSRQDRFLKNFLNFAFWGFLVFGIYLILFVPDDPKNYPRFQGYIALLSAFLFLAPALLYQVTRLRERYHADFVTAWKGLLGIPLILNALGARWFFDLDIGYDSFLHFLSSWFFGLFIAFILFLIADHYEKKPQMIIAFFLVLALTIVGGVSMELYERYSDLWWGTRQWGQLGQDPWYDTFLDIVFDLLGAMMAGVTLMRYQWTWFERLKTVKESPSFLRIQGAVKKAAKRTKKNFSTLQKKIRESSHLSNRFDT